MRFSRIRYLLEMRRQDFFLNGLTILARVLVFGGSVKFALYALRSPLRKDWLSVAEALSFSDATCLSAALLIAFLLVYIFIKGDQANEIRWMSPDLDQRMFRMWMEKEKKVREKPKEKAKLKRMKSPPGFKLRALAEFFFSPKVYQEIFEPTLRDLYDEYCEALNAGRPKKAVWVRARGYWSFWSAVVAQTPISIVKRVYQIWKAIA